ncbi:MAG TPA: CoA-binding protein [Candidatus Binatia bacterium]|nr:CoA-binding protein [Candidatus Binatia bacterium]
MGRLTRDEAQVERLLRAARTIAVVGASARRGAPASAVVPYLRVEGFDVFPVRQDGADVAGLKSWPSLADVPGSLDVVLVVAGAVPPGTLETAAAKRARLVWLQPGVPVGDAAARATALGLRLVHDRDLRTEQRHTEAVAGQPRKRGVTARTDNRKRPDGWHVVGGGGGRKSGGGRHAVLDEKKMAGGKPSPRRDRPLPPDATPSARRSRGRPRG